MMNMKKLNIGATDSTSTGKPNLKKLSLTREKLCWNLAASILVSGATPEMP
jgi:hypothetical protein